MSINFIQTLSVSGEATFTDTNGTVAISGGNINLTDSGGGTMITLDSSSGDGTVRWEDNNTQKWDMGRDNTNNNWVLSNSAGLGSSDVISVAHATGVVTISSGIVTSSSSTMAGINLTSGIAMGTNAITGMADPSSAQDAATKAYVDSQISGVPQGTVTSVATGTGLTGGTITSSGTISVDSSVVLTNNTQTISGAKTISDTLTMSADIDFESSNASILLGASSTLQVDGDSGVGKYLKSVSGGLQWTAITQNAGTVTSVGITAGTGISVSGSPITSSGSITVTNTITNNNQLTNGAGYTTNAGTVTSIATTSPITGGTITGSGTIAFDSTAVTSLTNLNTTGTITDGVWNSDRKIDKTSTTDLSYQGDIVYWSSTTVTGGKVYVYSGGDWVAADADAESTSKGTLAIALGNGASNSVGMLIRGTYTLNYDPGNDGDILHLSTTAGNLIVEPPSGSGDVVRIVGQLLDSTNGQIWFNPDFTYITLS